MGSTRFPGKPLALVAGKPLIIRVAELAKRSDAVDQVLIATDSPEILAVAAEYGITAVPTSPSAHCGTDRVAEVAKTLTAGIVVNLQADELLADPRMIDQTVAPLLADGRIPMSTLRRRINAPEDIANPNIVKVVANQRNLALYFSRSPIPMDRDGLALLRPDITWDQHLGIYAFRKAALLEFARLPVSVLEETEKARTAQGSGLWFCHLCRQNGIFLLADRHPRRLGSHPRSPLRRTSPVTLIGREPRRGPHNKNDGAQKKGDSRERRRLRPPRQGRVTRSRSQ
jgi:CMP-2-keto-3-deoxyoctulosonic acid synthetase